MFGSMFSGFEQSGGETVEKMVKNLKNISVLLRITLCRIIMVKKSPSFEGRYTLIPYKGDIHEFYKIFR